VGSVDPLCFGGVGRRCLDLAAAGIACPKPTEAE
jgi:hypothetical protein